MLEIKGVRFDVEITHKRIKNLYLRVDGNKVIASAPLFMADHEVYRFIESKRNWIYRTYERLSYKEKVTRLYRGGDIFYIFDRPYRLIRQEGKKSILIRDDAIYLNYSGDDEDAIRYLYKHLDKKLLSEAQRLMDKHLPFLKDYGYDDVPELKCRIMSSKWGVCFTKKNRINISSYLIHYPLECLEYIMVHEMTHFIVPNHSKRFYEVIYKNLPTYKEAVERLRL